MVVDNDCPQWAKDYVSEWQQKLFLQEWEIRLQISPTPNGDGMGNTLGCVSVWPDIMVAEIELHDDVSSQPEEKWQRVIIHELVHIRLGRISDFVERDAQQGPVANNTD